jgi:hypothetical protein
MSRLAPPLVFAVLVAVPSSLQAQARAAQGWKPMEIGLRAGYDNNSRGSVVGAQIHVPVLPSGIIDLSPNADITFNPGLRDYQFAVDAIFLAGARRAGFFGGVGVVSRSSIYSDGETQREWKTGWNLVAGIRTTADPGATLPVGIQLEMRWVFVDDVYKPQVLTFGINVPLWGWGRRR